MPGASGDPKFSPVGWHPYLLPSRYRNLSLSPFSFSKDIAVQYQGEQSQGPGGLGSGPRCTPELLCGLKQATHPLWALVAPPIG